MLDYLADHRGVATSDVRSIEPCLNKDAYRVRLWNHRRIEVTSLEFFLSLRGLGSNQRPSP